MGGGTSFFNGFGFGTAAAAAPTRLPAHMGEEEENIKKRRGRD